jgi:hypothetical protein
MRLTAVIRNAKNAGQKTIRFRDNFQDLVLLDRPDFDGPVYDRRLDRARLAGQILRVYELMRDGKWRTLDEIQANIWAHHAIKEPPASISAQLRHLRKERYGSHHVEKRRRGESGLWEYRLEKALESRPLI